MNDAVLAEGFFDSIYRLATIESSHAIECRRWRKFIMAQLLEPRDANSEAHKLEYKNIYEIGKERIQRAGAKIKADESLSY